MGDILNKIKSDLMKKGYAARSIESRVWLRNKLRRAALTRSSLDARGRGRDNTIIGKMYFFSYDPKTKDKLPYYDAFPLVFPIEMYGDGFLGLNLHYLDTGLRLLLLDKLATNRTTKTINDRTRLVISYKMLNETARLTMAQPCIKRYLYSHVQSKFIEVYPEEWDQAVLLPLARFKHASSRKVHSQSRKSING